MKEIHRSIEDHEKHGEEFETWVSDLQEYRLAVWYESFDCGYYEDNWIQGAWIAWLHLTGRRK